MRTAIVVGAGSEKERYKGMNIGILSMQRIYNYGSFLQAYALKATLEGMGHKVYFVDIERINKKTVSKPQNSLQKLLSRKEYIDRYLFKRYLYSKKNAEMDQMFRKIQKEYFGISPGEEHVSARGCDMVVIGSDEIFNCEPNSQWGVTSQRFGDIPGMTTISYAASCGYTSITDIVKKDRAIIKEALRKMKAISVRDQNTLEFVQYFGIKNASINLDPVFIYAFDQEICEAECLGWPNYPYMVVYAYHNRIEKKEEVNTIKKYAKNRGLRTIAIGGSLPWCDEFAVISPFQVLVYFKHADCIVTDTFHGTVMAAKLNKPLAVLVRESNKNKLGDLLNRISIESHRVDCIECLKDTLDKPLNYESANRIIENEKQRALLYLQSALEMEQ